MTQPDAPLNPYRAPASGAESAAAIKPPESPDVARTRFWLRVWCGVLALECFAIALAAWAVGVALLRHYMKTPWPQAIVEGFGQMLVLIVPLAILGVACVLQRRWALYVMMCVGGLLFIVELFSVSLLWATVGAALAANGYHALALQQTLPRRRTPETAID